MYRCEILKRILSSEWHTHKDTKKERKYGNPLIKSSQKKRERQKLEYQWTPSRNTQHHRMKERSSETPVLDIHVIKFNFRSSCLRCGDAIFEIFQERCIRTIIVIAIGQFLRLKQSTNVIFFGFLDSTYNASVVDHYKGFR